MTCIPHPEQLHVLLFSPDRCFMLSILEHNRSDDTKRTQFLGRNRFQLHRRREATRGGTIAEPSLQRTVSAPAHSWPANKQQKYPRQSNVHGLLEYLVIASCAEDVGETDGIISTEETTNPTAEDQYDSPLFSTWQRKGPRIRARQLRIKSMALAPRANIM